jgi:hypothetical protein
LCEVENRIEVHSKNNKLRQKSIAVGSILDEFSTFYHGIIYEGTLSYSSQSNEIAERKKHTLN